MKMAYPACFYKDSESGSYSVEVPDLPGCASGGESLADAILMGADAASGWVLTWLEKGRALPQPSPIENIKPAEECGFVSMLVLDMDEYAKKHGQKSIRKTLDLEIPAYLATFAESRRIDISRIAQDALSELFLKQP
jgi:predicted RNase H-like HicB family nuclease